MKSQWPDWAVYKRDLCKCAYCDLDGLGDFNIFRQLVIDHLIPKAEGGPNFPENKVVCCPRCNTFKGRYNPAGAKVPSDLFQNQESFKKWITPQRAQLIEKAKTRINAKDEAERADYLEMKQEIEEGK